MTTFSITFSNVLLSLLYLVPGYILCKCRKAQPGHLSTVSVILLYICAPGMFLNALVSLERSPELTGQMALFLAVSLVVELLFILILFLLFRSRRNEFRFRMLTVASAMGNVGFFGLPIVQNLFPGAPVAASYSCMFCASMNILAWTLGVFCITGERRYISLRAAFLNPTVIAVAAGFVLYLLQARRWLPSLLTDGMRTLSGMTTPLCMFILGIRLATMDLKELFGTPFVYGVAGTKLVLFPLFSFLLVQLLPADPVFKASILVLSATPCASILLNLSEIHGSGQKLAANCALLSTLLSIVTLPLLSLLI